MEPLVEALRRPRSLEKITVATSVAGIGDLGRFDRPIQLRPTVVAQLAPAEPLD